MSDKTTGFRCQDGDACAAGQRPCPSPAACGCDPADELPDALKIANTCRDARIDTDCPLFQSTALADAEYAIRKQHVRIAELEAAEALHLQELRAYELTAQNLRARLEIEPGHSVDGIDARDATIKLQDERIADLEAQLSAIGAGGVESLRKREQSVPWDNFPSYLIDHCEGDTITEEGLQFALAAMLKNPQYAAQPSREFRQQSAAEDAVTLLRKYKKLCETVGRGDGCHLKRIEDAAAALQNAPPVQAQDFDAWQANPYTKVLQKSIAEDYAPKAAPAQEHATQLAGQGQAYSIDADPEGIRARVAEAITGALASGGKKSDRPSDEHWLRPFWMHAYFAVVQYNGLSDSAETMLAAPAQAQEDALDAERYRWLFDARTKEQTESASGTIGTPLPQDELLSRLQCFYFHKAQVDSLIDAAAQGGQS